MDATSFPDTRCWSVYFFISKYLLVLTIIYYSNHTSSKYSWTTLALYMPQITFRSATNAYYLLKRYGDGSRISEWAFGSVSMGDCRRASVLFCVFIIGREGRRSRPVY